MLLNSPTFNTLDNRFEQLNQESRNVLNGGITQKNSSREHVNPQNYFAELTTWPGLKNATSAASQQSMELDDGEGPRLASPNALAISTPMNDEFMPPDPICGAGGISNNGLLSQRDSLTNKSDRSKRV